MARFKVGDVVELNSGGPDMTVQCVERDYLEKDHVDCMWFDDRKLLREGTFATATLRKSG